MRTVLIIDDEPNLRDILGKLLKAAGWKVLSAADGEQGIKLARKHRPQAVVCDLLMPRGNGFALCRSLRNDSRLRRTKIIVLSGRDYDSDRLAAMEAGANEYLTKPVQPRELMALLTKVAADERAPGKFPDEKSKRGRDTPKGRRDAGPTSPASSSGLRLKFWGVRGSIPTPGSATIRYGGNTSCVEVRSDGHILILDAGTGLRPLGHALEAEFDNRPLQLTLLLTHTHWDHIQGLPFFLPAYRPQNHLRILGYEGAKQGLESVLTGQMESPFFPVELRKLPANLDIEELKEMNFTIGPFRIEAFFANHPGICVGYRLFTAHGSITFFPDFEPRWAHLHHPMPGRPTAAASLAFARREDQKMTSFLKNSDVLIMDSQYDREEYAEHVGWGHSCVDDVVALALKARVKRLFLFHHDPEHDDAKIARMVRGARKLAKTSKGNLQVDAAREGAVFEPAERRSPTRRDR